MTLRLLMWMGREFKGLSYMFHVYGDNGVMRYCDGDMELWWKGSGVSVSLVMSYVLVNYKCEVVWDYGG